MPRQLPGCMRRQCKRREEGPLHLCISTYLQPSFAISFSFVKCESQYLHRASIFFLTRLKDAKSPKERSSYWRLRKRVSWNDFVLILNSGIFRISSERNENQNFMYPLIKYLLHIWQYAGSCSLWFQVSSLGNEHHQWTLKLEGTINSNNLIFQMRKLRPREVLFLERWVIYWQS